MLHCGLPFFRILQVFRNIQKLDISNCFKQLSLKYLKTMYFFYLKFELELIHSLLCQIKTKENNLIVIQISI